MVGATQAAATTAITGAGLTLGAVTQASSASVASGEVISETPAAGGSVAVGSAVALVISTGSQTQTVGGTVIGLTSGATVHVLNGADNVAISANGPFSFPTAVNGGATYSVTVGTPSSAQACGVQNGTGTVGSASVTNVVVYCTFTVSNATMDKAYGEIVADFHLQSGGGFGILDYAGTDAYDGDGNRSITATIDFNGISAANQQSTTTYAVTTANAIPSLDGAGGIQGANANLAVDGTVVAGVSPLFVVDVLPDTSATTDSVSGNYTLAFLTASVSTGVISGGEGPITFTNGTISGSYTANSGGTITTGNAASGQYTVSNGSVSLVGEASGSISADDNLIILADTTSGDDPQVTLLLHRGSGVTQATFQGVYAVVEYGGTPVGSTFSKGITLLALGDGTFTVNFTKNSNGTITANNTGSGTYTIGSDGTLTLTDSEGEVYNGAVSADGNALVLESVASQQNPAIFVGTRQ